MVATVSLGVWIVLSLETCAARMALREGQVVDRYHREAYTTTTCTPGYRGMVSCSSVRHPEVWQVTIQNGSNTATWDVDEGTYYLTHGGDWYCAEDEILWSGHYSCQGPGLSPEAYTLEHEQEEEEGQQVGGE